VAGGVARVERDVKNAATDREAAAMVTAGVGYKKEIDLSGPTGTRGRTCVDRTRGGGVGGDGKFHL